MANLYKERKVAHPCFYVLIATHTINLTFTIIDQNFMLSIVSVREKMILENQYTSSVPSVWESKIIYI